MFGFICVQYASETELKHMCELCSPPLVLWSPNTATGTNSSPTWEQQKVRTHLSCWASYLLKVTKNVDLWGSHSWLSEGVNYEKRWWEPGLAIVLTVSCYKANLVKWDFGHGQLKMVWLETIKALMEGWKALGKHCSVVVPYLSDENKFLAF